LAFNGFGNGNTVTAGPGPVVVAGSLFQNGRNIIKVGPGININGFAVGGAAAVRGSAASASATASRSEPTAKKSGGSKSSGVGGTKRRKAN
jgi:hypothetical protein